jgi:teichuronic acid exporter
VGRLVGIGISWKLVGQIAKQLTRLLTVVVLARFLTPADYGTAAIAATLATFASTVADMGIGTALVQAQAASQTVRSTAFWASIGFGLGLFVLAAAAADPIARFMNEPEVSGMVVAGALTFAIYSVGSTSHAVFMREMRFRSIEMRTWLALRRPQAERPGGQARGDEADQGADRDHADQHAPG